MSLIGLDSVLKKFGKLPERVTTLTKAAVSRNTDQIFAESMSQVPKNTGGLAGSGQKIVTDLTGTVSYGGGSVDYAAYVEFGTGSFAKTYLSGMPKEIKAYAWTFKRPKDGFRPATPFLIPAYLKYRKQFFKDMKDIAKIISK